MRILVYTSLYPGPWAPGHGIFVKELVRHLPDRITAEILVPENGWRKLLALPGPSLSNLEPPRHKEHRCLFWTIPQFFKHLDGRIMAAWSRAAFQASLAFRPQLLHVHYAYPDAAAALILSRLAGLPLIVTCHGSDIHVLSQAPRRRAVIAQTLRQAAAVVTVSGDMAGKVADLGVSPSRIHAIANGVDCSLFVPGDQARAKSALGLADDGPLLAAVGRLEPVKGYDRLLQALRDLPGTRLLLAGDGSQRTKLMRLAASLGIRDRLHFLGAVPHAKLATVFQAADLLVLSSHSEGWPTVIHEAMACGKPVVAPAVGGIPEALADMALGVVIPTGEPRNLVRGIRQALDTPWQPDILRTAAMRHDWRCVSDRYCEIYARVLAESLTSQREPAPKQPTPAS